MPESYLMWFVGIIVGGFIASMILRVIFKKYDISISREPGNNLRAVLSWAVKDKEIRTRALVTVAALIVLRAAFFLPLPGIDLEAYKEILSKVSLVQGGSVLMQLFGGAMDRMTIFAFGLMPFFSSCMIIQLASAVIPKLRQLSFGGEQGRAEISKYTYVITIILCLVQAYFLASSLDNPARFQGLELITMPGWGFRLVCATTLTAAVMFLLFIAELITRYGIGNGVAVIAVSTILLRLFVGVKQFIALSSLLLPFVPILLGIIFSGVICGIYFITNRARSIELQDSKSKRIFIHFRPTIAGCAPIRFAQTIVLFPATIASITGARGLYDLFMKGHALYNLVYVVLIVMLTYLYTRVVFDPKYILSIVGKYGYTLVENKGGKEKDSIEYNMSKLLIITALFLAALALIPDLVKTFFRVPYLMASFFGGTAIAFAVGVFSDIVRQLEFFKDKRESGIKDWDVCYIAFDEIEAKVKSEYLKKKGVPALVEPLRFTWGMPIRTIVDQYRIYVPTDKKEEAGNLKNEIAHTVSLV